MRRQCLLDEQIIAASGNIWLFFGCRHEQRDYLFR